MDYAKKYKQQVNEKTGLGFVNVSSLLTKSASGSTDSGLRIFLDNNLELIRQYKFKKALADFYARYSGHLQDRRERLSNSLQTLTTVHDNLSIIWDKTA